MATVPVLAAIDCKTRAHMDMVIVLDLHLVQDDIVVRGRPRSLLRLPACLWHRFQLIQGQPV